MSVRKRLVVLLFILLVLGVLGALLSPWLISRGTRYWIEWAAKREGMTAEIGRIEAPFLGSVAIDRISLRPAAKPGRDVSLTAENLTLDFDFRGRILGKKNPILRSLVANEVSATIQSPAREKKSGALDWRVFEQLLPGNFALNHCDLDFSGEGVAIRFRDLNLSASAIESGRFLAREISFDTPILRRRFADLRGATSWENERLTIAGIPLVRGLDLEALTLDFSRLARRRLGVDLQLDTYGGTLRASVQGRGGDKFSFEIAGSAANISLAQLSNAFGFLEPATGSVRASKFTFRGNPGEFLDATASIWMEVTDFAWRARRAESVMLGATYYDRRLEVNQLYVRQRQNELTVNGELAWPKRWTGWTHLPFRGQLNATVPDLNRFAELLGAPTGDFSGELTAEGDLNLVDPEASGRLSFEGKGVKFRGVSLDSLGGALRLRGDEAVLEKLQAQHQQDFLRGQGTWELGDGHRFSARLTGAINDLGDYAPLLPEGWRNGKIAGGATFDWRGDGTLAAQSGTIQLYAHGLQLPVAPFRRPLDLTLEGSYSPQDIFFRNFKLAGDQFSLGGFLMLGADYIELQSFEVALAGRPKISGTLFLPISFSRWRATGDLVAALDEKQKFDVDLAVQRLDLAQFSSVLGEDSSVTGVLDGKLAAFGPLTALQMTAFLRLENLGPAKAPNQVELSGQLADGRVEADWKGTFGASSPITAHASLPLRLEKLRLRAGKVLDESAPFSLTIECPALLWASLPDEWRAYGDGGLLSGQIQLGGTVGKPAVQGEADLFDGNFNFPPPWPEVVSLGAHLQFHDHEAAIAPLRCRVDSQPLNLTASLTTSAAGFSLEMQPADENVAVFRAPPSGSSLLTARMLPPERTAAEAVVRRAIVRGRFHPFSASLTMITSRPDESSLVERSTFFFPSRKREAEPLLLQTVPAQPLSLLPLEKQTKAIAWPGEANSPR